MLIVCLASQILQSILPSMLLLVHVYVPTAQCYLISSLYILALTSGQPLASWQWEVCLVLLHPGMRGQSCLRRWMEGGNVSYQLINSRIMPQRDQQKNDFLLQLYTMTVFHGYMEAVKFVKQQLASSANYSIQVYLELLKDYQRSKQLFVLL